MSACPECHTMISRPVARHRDLIGGPCPGLPTDPVCGVCGRPVGLDEHGNAGVHTSDDQQCHGSTRRATTAELWAGRDHDDLEQEAAA
jgi:hypothetical protein